MSIVSIEELIHGRWSPREYELRPVADELLHALFESVRWAQSSYNEQPWRFLIATAAEPAERERLEACLHPGNAFARAAPVLGVVFARRDITANGKPNPHAAFDTGAACQILALQAFALGLNTRFMAGFDVALARRLGPPELDPMAMFVVGYASARALGAPPARKRKPLSEILIRGSWEKT